MKRRYKIPIYIATLSIASWIPFDALLGAQRLGPPMVVGTLEGIVLVAVVEGGLIWAIWR